MTNNTGSNPKVNYKLVATGTIAAAAFAILFVITIKFTGGNKSITYLLCLLGFIFGWIMAIFSTPYDKRDEAQLNRFGKLVGTFLTGYILSKSDKIFEKVISPDFIFTPIEGGRILFFLCYFGLAWIVVFVYRQYATGET